MEIHHAPAAADAYEAGFLAGLTDAWELINAQGGRIDANDPIQVATSRTIDECLAVLEKAMAKARAAANTQTKLAA